MSGTDDGVIHIDVGQTPHIRRIAVISTDASEGETSIVWLGGYRSDMSGTKAVALEAHARSLDTHFVRFDYSGHGQSSGHYTDGFISLWLEEALAVIGQFARQRLVLVGSSMGGWIAFLLIRELSRRIESKKIAGMVLIAPAPDFTTVLIEPQLKKRELRSLTENGYFDEKSEYSTEPNRYTQKLLDDGRENQVMNGLIVTGCPVHILQGMRDRDVPYGHALKIMDKIVGDDAILTLIRDGDHRLSRPEDIDRMLTAVTAMVKPA